jgi:2-isopropylmalate synthase
MQSAAGTFTQDQSVEVAALLARCGVDAIECGHPAISKAELLRVAAVVEAAGGVPVLGHGQTEQTSMQSPSLGRPGLGSS